MSHKYYITFIFLVCKEIELSLWINIGYADRQAHAICVDLDQISVYMASDQGLHYLPLIQQFADTSTDSKVNYEIKF